MQSLDPHCRKDSSPASSSCLDIDYVPEFKRSDSVYDELSINYAEFRLLQIEPTDDPTARIIARLFKASLDDPPPFEAVSYRWERTKKSHFIMINGVKFPVMSNVCASLSEFRRQSHPSSSTFWIDSLCIKQSCIQDRNIQVQLMGRIYSAASLVRMWIGSEFDLAGQAFELIRHCGPSDQISAELVAARVVQNEAGTRAVTKLLERDYWNRMWVFQEIVLAKDAVVHCGKLQVPWSNLRWLDAVSSKHELWRSDQIEKPWILDFRKAFFRIAHFCICPHEARYINNVLHPTRHLQCQDPRDKLYALKGVCEALTEIVEVDYSISVRDVFTAFAKNKILQDGDLSVLLTAGMWSPFNGDNINLPSWVPDLRGMGDVDIRYLAGTYTNEFDADGGVHFNQLHPVKSESFSEKDGNSIFEVHAILFGSIQSHRSLRGISHSDVDRKELIETFCSWTHDGKFSMLNLRQLFDGLIFSDSTTSMRCTHTEGHNEEVARGLVLGFYTDLNQLFGSDPVFIQFLESFEHSIPDSRTYRSLQEEVKLSDPNLLRLNRKKFLSRAAETTERQATALFLTVDGTLGTGPRGVQQDDMVCIIRGCRVPLILRLRDAYYSLIGPAYVSGIMHAVWADERSEKMGFEPIQLI